MVGSDAAIQHATFGDASAAPQGALLRCSKPHAAGPQTPFGLALQGCGHRGGTAMSDFVQFPLTDYDKAGFENFDGRVSAFTLKNAYAMMWFAQLAYEVDTSGADRTAAKIDTIRDFWKFSPATTFRARAGGIPVSFDTTGVYGERKDAVVLAFAGTDPAVWVTLATDFSPRIGPSHTHVGLQAAMDAVRNDIDAAVALSRTSGKPLFIAG